MDKFTGNKDVDFIILSQLSDRDLMAVCSVNKHAKKLCENENFWRKRLYMNPIIINLMKEFKDAQLLEDSFYKLILEIKEFLEYQSWKDFYFFLFHNEDKYIRLTIVDSVRESIVRYHVENHDNFLNTLSEMNTKEVPKWININELRKELKREYFWGLSRGHFKGSLSYISHHINEKIKRFIWK